MALNLDDLLDALSKASETEKKLANTKENWARLGRRDSFEELGLSGQELEDFLKEWAQENPYSNI